MVYFSVQCSSFGSSGGGGGGEQGKVIVDLNHLYLWTSFPSLA